MLLKKYVNMLSGTTIETLEKINEYEKSGKFNDHLDNAVAPYVPVDKNYDYLRRGFSKKLKDYFYKLFIVKPFIHASNKTFKTEVRGKENLKGLKSAIICSNHINKLDGTMIKHALGRRKVYYTTAEFNNMQGFLGEMMRIGGILPMSENFSAQKNFSEAIEYLLKHKKFVVFFPESAEWWGYKKPRPHKRGAYHFAIKNNVPILPIFITFEETETSKKDPTYPKQHVVNILPPIYKDENLTDKENEKMMMEKCIEAYKKTYENFYNEKL